jgi:hypothetical protein
VPVVLGLWLLTGVGQASVGPVADVKLVAGRVLIDATASSVSEVLDRLSRATGMKVVYEGGPPTDRLTAAINAGSETEALSRLFEGLGLTYAFKLDAAGRHVETLFVTSASHRAASGTGTMSSASSAPRMNAAGGDDSDNEAAPIEGPDPANDPVAVVPPMIDNAGMAAANPNGTGSPGYSAGGQAGGVPTSGSGIEEQSPAFPSGASFPGTGPSAPTPPAFPGPASYP